MAKYGIEVNKDRALCNPPPPRLEGINAVCERTRANFYADVGETRVASKLHA